MVLTDDHDVRNYTVLLVFYMMDVRCVNSTNVILKVAKCTGVVVKNPNFFYILTNKVDVKRKLNFFSLSVKKSSECQEKSERFDVIALSEGVNTSFEGVLVSVVVIFAIVSTEKYFGIFSPFLLFVVTIPIIITIIYYKYIYQTEFTECLYHFFV